MGIFSAIGAGLRRISFSARIDDEYFDELEEQLIMADVGVETSVLIVERLRERAKRDRLSEAEQLRPVIQEVVRELLAAPGEGGAVPTENPRVLLMIGVNASLKSQKKLAQMSLVFTSGASMWMLGGMLPDGKI